VVPHRAEFVKHKGSAEDILLSPLDRALFRPIVLWSAFSLAHSPPVLANAYLAKECWSRRVQTNEQRDDEHQRNCQNKQQRCNRDVECRWQTSWDLLPETILKR